MVPLSVVSPHVQVQFQTQFDGSDELEGAGGADGIAEPLDAEPDCDVAGESPAGEDGAVL